jgi:hypothetical protein
VKQLVIETADLERIKSEVGKTVYKSRYWSEDGVNITYYKMNEEGTGPDMAKVLQGERVPKKSWTGEDKKRVKDCIHMNRKFGPMLNEIFADAMKMKSEGRL